MASVCVTKETANFHQNKSNGRFHKNITIVNDAFGVFRSDDTIWGITHDHNRTVRLKSVNNYLNTNIYSSLETSGVQSSNLYLNVVQFFNTSVN